jgi:hypothetical protein
MRVCEDKSALRHASSLLSPAPRSFPAHERIAVGQRT